MFKNRVMILLSALLLLCFTQVIAAAQYSVVSETFNVTPGETLTVDAVSADIEIRNVPDTVTVNVKGMREEYRKWLEIRRTADGVLVRFDPEKNTRMRDSLVFEIGVPAEYNLDIETSGGDILVADGIRGNVSLESSGGDIECRAKIVGLLSCETSGGDIDVSDVEGNSSLSTSGGDITVRSVSGDAEVETSGGDIEIQAVRGRLKASTAGGDIMVEEVGGDASLHTAGGDLNIGSVSGDLDAQTAGGDITAEAVRGDTRAETAGGDIKMENLGGGFDAATIGGDVLVSLDGSYAGKMSTLGGDLTLLLPASARVSVDAQIKLSRNDHGESNPITSEFGNIELERRGSVINTVSSEFAINGGGPVIEMRNLSGTIAVKKLP